MCALRNVWYVLTLIEHKIFKRNSNDIKETNLFYLIGMTIFGIFTEYLQEGYLQNK